MSSLPTLLMKLEDEVWIKKGLRTVRAGEEIPEEVQECVVEVSKIFFNQVMQLLMKSVGGNAADLSNVHVLYDLDKDHCSFGLRPLEPGLDEAKLTFADLETNITKKVSALAEKGFELADVELFFETSSIRGDGVARESRPQTRLRGKWHKPTGVSRSIETIMYAQAEEGQDDQVGNATTQASGGSTAASSGNGSDGSSNASMPEGSIGTGKSFSGSLT